MSAPDYPPDIRHLLAASSIRRLWCLRHGPHGTDARKAIHQWVGDLRVARTCNGFAKHVQHVAPHPFANLVSEVPQPKANT